MPGTPASSNRVPGDTLIRRKSTVVIVIVLAAIVFLWTQKTPWQIGRYDRWAREDLERFRALVEQGRELVARSPRNYDYNQLRDIRNRLMVLKNSSDDLPFSISGNREIKAVNARFHEAMELMPVHFSSEDIKQPTPGLPPELHDKYVRAMAELTKWKEAFDAMKAAHKVRGGRWEVKESVPY